MKIRVAKKIVKNAEKLAYHKHQIEKAELVVKRWKKNAPAQATDKA